ncbi:hypothetical protein HDE_02879 [Halotydeus destructor]|nr:hypothetical protein HDE_02879 [Halotydeus destructor]
MDVNPTQEFLDSRQLPELQKVVDGLKKVLEVVKFSKDKELGTNHRDEIERYLDFIEKHLKTDPLRWFCVDVSYKNHLQDLTDEQFEVLHLESLSLTEFFVKGFLTLLAQVNIVESDAISANSWLAQAVVQCLVALVSFWAGKELETAKSLQENLARLAYDIAKFVSGGDPGSVICITSSNGKHLVELRCFGKASTELFAASNTLLSNPYDVGKVLKIPSILLQLTDNGDYDILQNLFLGLTKVLSSLQSSKVCGPFRQKHDLGDMLIYAALCDNLNMLSQSFHLYNETPSLDTLELREENQFLVCVFAATKIALNQETNLAYMVALKQSWKRLTSKVTKITDPSHGVVIVNDILNRLTSELEACVLPKFLIHGSLDEVCYQLLEYFMNATSVDNDDIPLYLSHLRRLFTIISTKAIHLDVSKTHWLTLSSVGMLEDVLFYERMNVGSQESSFADTGSQETDASVNTEEMRTQSTSSSEPDFQYHFNHELLFDRQIQEFISLYHSIEDSENIDPEDLCRIANICSTVFQFRFLIQERKPTFSTVNTKSVMKNFATFLNELDLFVDGLCCQLSNHQVGHAAIENTMNLLKIYAKYRFSGSMKDTSSTCLRGNSYFKQVLEFPVSNRTGDVNAPFINNTTEFEAYVELCGYLKLEDWASLKDKIYNIC